MDYRSLKIALLGCGRVGSCVARILLENTEELQNRTGGLRMELVGIGVKTTLKKREFHASLYTDDLDSLILNADVVVELIGGVHPAKELITKALNLGADVVSANKTLIAAHGPELISLASSVGAQFLYEAAVCAAIPVIKPLRDSLSGDVIQKITGIVNGTTNFILDRMESTGDSLEEAFREAQELGYAESDPVADLEGHDAAAKAAILASLAFHTRVPLSSIYCEGITQITQETIKAAKAGNKLVRLLAICERIKPHAGSFKTSYIDTTHGQLQINPPPYTFTATNPADNISGEQLAVSSHAASDTGSISVRVHPALIDRAHPLSSVRGNKNAIFVVTQLAGPLMFYGSGAGGLETASAVLGDIVSIARRYKAGSSPSSEIGTFPTGRNQLHIAPMSQIRTRYQIVLLAVKSPSVLQAIAKTFAENKVLLDSLIQSQPDSATHTPELFPQGAAMRLVLVTDFAEDSVISSAIEGLQQHSSVVSIVSVMRIEHGNLQDPQLLEAGQR